MQTYKKNLIYMIKSYKKFSFKEYGNKNTANTRKRAKYLIIVWQMAFKTRA